jgi:hypothetical protein
VIALIVSFQNIKLKDENMRLKKTLNIRWEDPDLQLNEKFL